MNTTANDAMTHFDLVTATKQKVNGKPQPMTFFPVDPVVKVDKSYPVESQIGLVPETQNYKQKIESPKISHEIKSPLRPMGA